jgi:hypothetical protein
MTSRSKSQQRRAENEVVFKQINERVMYLAKRVLDTDSQTNLSLNFYCECADEVCHDDIPIPLDEYEHLRSNNRQFLVKAGHEQPDIEKVTSHQGYFIVEKFFTPPPTDGNLNLTHL